MTYPVLPANGPSGYNLTNSLRFRSSASAYLNRTPASAGNRQIMTYSFWVKRGAITGDYNLTNATTDASNSATLYFNSSNNQTFDVFLKVGGTNYSLTTSQVFRDPSAWYHIVVAIDTTQATSSNRTKVYVNGSQVTNFLTANYVPQNSNLALNNNVAQYIGYSSYFDGYMTEINFIDGQALTPSSFGSTNATTGVWQPAKYTGTYGTNGFYLPFSSFITGGSLTSATVNGFSSYAYNESGADYVKTASTSAFNVGTGNFTLEAFIKFNTVDTWDFVLSYNSSNVQQQNMLYYYHPTGEISYYDQNTAANLTCAYTFTAGVWYHVALVRNSGTLRMYINGVVQPSTLGYTTNINTISYLQLASQTSRASTKGQISNLRFNNTAVYTSNFTPSTSALTAISGTQLLTFQNSTLIDNSTNALALTNTATGNPSAIADNSGNGNYWNFNNMNLSTSTATTYDWMKDVPTLTSATVANYCVLNPLKTYLSPTISNGNLQASSMSGGATVWGTMAVSTGKWYFEATITAAGSPAVGIIDTNRAASDQTGYTATGSASYLSDGRIRNNNATSGTYSSYTTNDVIGVAFDCDTPSVSFYKNNTLQATVTPTSGIAYTIQFLDWNAGTSGIALNCGQRPFSYTPPTGYLALNTYNLPTSTIVQGNKYMDATTYTGTNGSPTTQVISSNFQPDFLWFKKRSAAYDHALIDTNRGITKQLYSNLTNAEGTDSNVLTAIGASSFTVGNSNYSNYGTLVAWTWIANGGTTSSNTQGSITSTVQANTTAGFSVATFTGASTQGATFGHGLGVAPKMVIAKSKTGATQNWWVYHTSLGYTNNIYLNSTAASFADANTWLATPSSTLVTIGDNFVTSATYVAYCWAEISGFSKFGSYTGNGSADGPFVFTGFRPKFVLTKRTNGAGDDWTLFDTARNTYNLSTAILRPNTSQAELSSSMDLLSNGFKWRQGGGNGNESGGTYIFMAFAENPFKNSLAR